MREQNRKVVGPKPRKRPLLDIISRVFSIAFIFGLLFLIEPLLAVLISSVLGGAYSFIYFFARRKLERVGQERFVANEQRSKIASEAFGAIKDLRVLGREQCFVDGFSVHAVKAEKKQIFHGLISQIPAYVMEVFAFGGILIIVLYLLTRREDFSHALPLIALYSFAGYRLLPALQRIFLSASLLRFNSSVLYTLHRDLTSLQDASSISENRKSKGISKLPLYHDFELNSVTFSYPGVPCPVIEGLNLRVEKNTSIGLVGGTGSGKTTLVDIILGLFTPQQGSFAVDGVTLRSDKVVSWRRNIGYVPQFIFLSDDTILNNIAFGIPTQQYSRFRQYRLLYNL